VPSKNQYITFSTVSPPLRVSCLLDGSDGAVAQVTEGYGGWTETDRARRRSITMWTGVKTMKMSVPVLFDGFATETDVEPAIRNLERMASPGNGITPPPPVKIIGAVPHTDITWVIDDIQWGTKTERAIGGKMLRQDLVVILWQYVADDVITTSPAASQRSKSAKTRSSVGGKQSVTNYNQTAYGYSPDPASMPSANTVYTTKAGDTVTSIATSQLGDYSAWREIAFMNEIRDPNAALPAGKKLRLPAP